MSITPDLEAVLDRHKVFLIGMEFFALDGKPAPTIGQVSEFLSARGVIAGISAGATYGSSASVVANIAGMEDDDSIVVASAHGQLGRGQEATEFFAGAAYSLRCQVFVDDEHLIAPDGTVEHQPERDVVLMTSSSLSLFETPTPLVAITSLLSMPAVGQYGRVEKYNMVLPQASFQVSPAALAAYAGVTPLITFEKSGQLRSVMLGCTDQVDYTVIVNNGPRYQTVGQAPQGTPVAELSRALSNIPLVMIDDEQVELGKKAKSKKFSGQGLLANLLDQAELLSACDPHEFFSQAAQALGLGPQVCRAVAAFEELPAPDVQDLDQAATQDPSALPPIQNNLGGYPLSTIDGGDKRPLDLVATMTMLESLLKQRPDGDLSKMKWWQRMRWTTSSLIGFAILLCLGIVFALTVAASGALAASLDMGTGSRVLAGFIAAVLCLALFGQLMAMKGIRPARRLLAQGRADGVLK